MDLVETMIFGADMNSSLHVGNKKSPIQGLDGTKLTAKKEVFNQPH